MTINRLYTLDRLIWNYLSGRFSESIEYVFLLHCTIIGGYVLHPSLWSGVSLASSYRHSCQEKLTPSTPRMWWWMGPMVSRSKIVNYKKGGLRVPKDWNTSPCFLCWPHGWRESFLRRALTKSLFSKGSMCAYIYIHIPYLHGQFGRK